MPSRYARKKGFKNTRKKIVIATEGEKCEPNYFEALKSKSKQNINIELLPTTKGFSSPDHVFTRLQQFKAKHQLDPEDQCWLIADVDRFQKQGTLQKAVRDCQEFGYFFAVTNPCFELWLLLHLENPQGAQSCSFYKRRLSQLLKPHGAGKNHGVFFMPHVEKAVERARILDSRSEDKWPQETGSHLYKLIEELVEPR